MIPDTPHSVALLWRSDQLDAETSTRKKERKKERDMSPVGFEPTIPKSERPQTHAINRTTSAIGVGSFRNANTTTYNVTLLHTYL